MLICAGIQLGQNHRRDGDAARVLKELVSQTARPPHVCGADVGIEQVRHSPSSRGRRGALRARWTCSMIASQCGSSARAPAVRRIPSPHFRCGVATLISTSTSCPSATPRSSSNSIVLPRTLPRIVFVMSVVSNLGSHEHCISPLGSVAMEQWNRRELQSAVG